MYSLGQEGEADPVGGRPRSRDPRRRDLQQVTRAEPFNSIDIHPGQIPLKVPNIEFDFDVSVDREHWKTVTSKSNLRPYNSVQMSIRCTVLMYC